MTNPWDVDWSKGIPKDAKVPTARGGNPWDADWSKGLPEGAVVPKSAAPVEQKPQEDPAVAKDRKETLEQIARAQKQIADYDYQLAHPDIFPTGDQGERVVGLAKAREGAVADIETLQRRLRIMDQTGQLPPAVTVGSAASDVIRGLPRGAIVNTFGLKGTVERTLGAGLQSLPSWVPDLGVGKHLSEVGKADEDWWQQAAEGIFGKPSEASQYSPVGSLAVKSGEGIGSFIPYLATEGLAGVAGNIGKAARIARAAEAGEALAEVPAATRAVRALNYPIAATQGSQQSGQQVDQFREQGGQVSPGQEFAARLIGAGLGLTEVGVVGNMVKRLPVSSRGAAIDAASNFVERASFGKVAPKALFEGVKDTIHSIEQRGIGRIGLSMAEEAAQEGFTQLGQNIAAQQIYNPKQDIFEGVSENMLVGAIAGGAISGGVEGIQKVAQRVGRRVAKDTGGSETEITPAIYNEAIRVLTDHVNNLMQQTPGLTRSKAVKQLTDDDARAILATAANNVATGVMQGGNAGTDQTAGPAGPAGGPNVAVPGGNQAGVSPAGTAAPSGAGVATTEQPDLGAVAPTQGGVGVSPGGANAQPTAVAEGQFHPDAMPIYTAPNQKARVAAAKPVVQNILDNMGVKVSKTIANQAATQMAQRAARMEVFDPTEVVQTVLAPHQEALQQKIEEANAKTQQQMQELAQQQADAQARLEAKMAPAEAQTEPTVAETATMEKLAPEEAAAEPTPEPTYTPQQIADNPLAFAGRAAEDAGLDPGMFKEGVRDVKRGEEPMSDEHVLDLSGQEGLDAYKAGQQWMHDRNADAQAAATEAPAEDPYAGVLADAQQRLEAGRITPEGLQIIQDRIAAGKEAEQSGIESRYNPKSVAAALERLTEPETGPEVSAEGNPDAEAGHMTNTVHGVAQAILNDFMVGDRVRVGGTPGIVVGLDGDYVRVRPDTAKHPKAYNRVPKTNVQFVSRPDNATTSSASKGEGQDAKFGDEAGQLNADMAGLVQLLGANMYAANVADVSVKELLQNAFDAVKGAISGKKAPSLYKDGKIEIILNREERTITIKDNARGMTPEIVRDAFFTVAGSDKSDLDPQDRSGGLGLAKMGFMMGADWLKLDTVRNGVRVTVDATSKEIASSNFTIKKSPAPEGEHGTTVTVKIPETYTDPKTGEAKDIWFPYSKDSVNILTKPLIGPVTVDFTYDHGYGTPDTETLPMGVNFPYDDYQKLEVKFDWGTADIYYGKERQKYPKHQVLSSGVYQFNERFMMSRDEVIPYDIIVNVKSDVEAKHPDYPFENSRERFKGRLENDTKALAGYLTKIARGAEAADLKETMQNVISMPRVEIGEEVKGLEGKLKKSFETGENEPARKLPELPTEVRITDEGVVDTGGRVVWDRVKEEEKNKPATFEAKEEAPTRDDFMIELDQDPRDPIFHNNTNFDPIKVGEAYGEPAKFFAELGSILVDMKEFLAKSGRYGYEALSPDNFFYAGIGIDKQYGGLHIKLPYKAVLLNPFYNWGARTLVGVREIMLDTMIHEIAHTGDMDHGVGHNTEMIKVRQYLADEGMLDYFRDAIMDTLLRHESTYTAMRDEYGRSTTQNIAKSLEDFGQKGSASREAGGAGDGGKDTSGAVPAGEGQGGDGDIQAAASTNPAGEKPGGTGATGEPVSNETVRKAVKLTPAQIRMFETKAGLRRQKVDNFQTKIVRSRSATEVNMDLGALIKLTHDPKEGLNVLRAMWKTFNVSSLKKIVFALDTENILRWKGDEIKNLRVIDRIMEDMRVYRQRKLQTLTEEIAKWDKFRAESPKGDKALGDIMMAATFYEVDPALAPNAEAYEKIDAKLQELIRKGAKPGQITTRKREIRRVYEGGVLDDAIGDVPAGTVVRGWNDLARADHGAGKGREIYKMARDAYKRNFDEHYDLLMRKVDESGLSEEDADEAKSYIEKMFEAARKKVVYFPAMRFGQYWLSIGKGANSEFHTFESATARNVAGERLRQQMEEAGDDREINEGDDIRELRNKVNNKEASYALKKIFDMLEGGRVEDMEGLKDTVFQMYLMALPESDMRKRFTQRKFKTGFSLDMLRNFTVAQHSGANQLARLAHTYRLRNAIGSAYSELQGNPDKPKLMPFVQTMEQRVMTELQPTTSPWDAWINLGTKVTAFWLMSAPRTALIEVAQLHTVGIPVMGQEFGLRNATAAIARYQGGALVGQKLGTTKKDSNGEIITDWGEPSIKDSKYIAALAESDPDLHEAMVYGWNYAHDRDAFAATYSADLTSRGKRTSAEHGVRAALAEGRPLSALSQGTQATMDFMMGAFHHMGRINREIMFMASFELAYKKAIKAGKDADVAKQEAAETALKLTNEALFDYSNYNKAPLMKNRVMRIPTQFMTYASQMTSLMVRNFYGMLPILNKTGKRDAARTFFGTMAMTFVYAGLRGLPLGILFWMLQGMRDWFRDDDDEAYKYADDNGDPRGKVDLQEWFTHSWVHDTFGEGSTIQKTLGLSDDNAALLARAVEYGPVSALSGWNLSDSVSLNNLWFTSPEDRSTGPDAFYKNVGKAVTGPAGSLAGRASRGAQLWHEGFQDRAVETWLPAFASNPAKAYRFSQEGLRLPDGTQVRGSEYYSLGKLLAQGAGLGDTEVAQIQQHDIAKSNVLRATQAKRSDLIKRFTIANDRLGQYPSMSSFNRLEGVQQEIDRFNMNFPDMAIGAEDTTSAINRRAKNAGEHAARLVQ